MQNLLVDDGLMEFVSIPWDNHRNVASNEYKSLTVNLALWFVHVLAGNCHAVDWTYNPLCSEQLAQRSGDDDVGVSTIVDEQEGSCEAQDPYPRKRKRLDEEDVLHASFTRVLFFCCAKISQDNFAEFESSCHAQQGVRASKAIRLLDQVEMREAEGLARNRIKQVARKQMFQEKGVVRLSAREAETKRAYHLCTVELGGHAALDTILDKIV